MLAVSLPFVSSSSRTQQMMFNSVETVSQLTLIRCLLPSSGGRQLLSLWDPTFLRLSVTSISAPVPFTIHFVWRTLSQQAFLPNFSHAVPEIALRDLRRAFHKNTAQQQEADEKSWKVASPPRGVADKRTSPEPEPTRSSPSPMRLGLQPQLLGSPPPSPTYDVADPSYAWMGQDGMEFDCENTSGRTAGKSMVSPSYSRAPRFRVFRVSVCLSVVCYFLRVHVCVFRGVCTLSARCSCLV